MKQKTKFSLALTGAALLLAASASANEEHKAIKGPFATPMDVTKKCLECHPDAAAIMKTSHWTWTLEQEVKGKGKITLGKKNAINNFCISIDGNWPRCTSCHISYGWKDASFDFNDQSRIDCLVCHDTTGKYKKAPPGAGMPFGYTGNPKFDEKKVDLEMVAQSVGKPGRANCVSCHGYGGGGDNVKHGDIDSTMANPPVTTDIHLSADGQNFSCQECHKTENHSIGGNALVVSPGGKNHFECSSCHEAAPHKNDRLNKHVASVACQTCHIPTYAKGMPTKVEWDWSSAGQNKEGEKDQYGKETYDKKKGDFKWGKDIVPAYAWYNGSASVYTRGDKIDPKKATKLSYPDGDIKDMNAKIYPFKVHTGKQPYDKKHKHFLTPKVWPAGSDADTAYWKSFDWDKALKSGAEYTGVAYSGSYDFAPTVMFWRINHMVAPAKEALNCKDCHSKKGRLDWKALGYKGDPMKVKGAARMSKKK